MPWGSGSVICTLDDGDDDPWKSSILNKVVHVALWRYGTATMALWRCGKPSLAPTISHSHESPNTHARRLMVKHNETKHNDSQPTAQAN